MNYISFVEEKHYTKQELLSTFSAKELSTLSNSNILKITEADNYKFSFVGVLSLSQIAFCILPKIVKNQLIQNVISNTINSLKIYSGNNTMLHDGIDYFSIEPDDPNCSELAIAEFLIDDFQRKGIYVVEHEKMEINGSGNISWSQTVMETDPIFSKNQPIYTDTLNQVIIDDRNHLTVAIHKWSIGYVDHKYIGLLGIDKMSLSFDYESEYEEIGSTEQLLRHLHEQLQITFSDRGIRLIKSLIYLIKRKAGLLPKKLSLFGTKKYENVWEAICKFVVNDNYKSGQYFPNPQWSFLDQSFISSSTLIPDITCQDKETGNFFLFDAKYYSLHYKTKLYGEPGYKDVLKQFQYQQHIERKIEKEISNAFLFPIDDIEFDKLKDLSGVIFHNSKMGVIGKVEYELYPSKKIWVIMCPFSKWQELYILRKGLDFKEIYWKA